MIMSPVEFGMKKITAEFLKKNCAAVIRDVYMKRETIVVTKRGKPVAKLVPVEEVQDDIFGFLKGKARIVGDVVSPVFTLEEWGDLA
jgi:prevent-host-death family protein